MVNYSRIEEFAELNAKDFYADDAAEDEVFLRPLQSLRKRDPKPWFQRYWCLITIHFILFSLNALLLTLYVTVWSTSKCTSDSVAALSPLQEEIKYEKHRFELLAIYKHDGDLNPHKTNSFNGPPRPELEAAWENLMQHADVRVSQDQLGEFSGDDSIVELTDGSGYYVTVSAFHGLHCVRRLHMYMYAEHYYQGLSEFDLFMLRRHTEHCLDWLRQHVQCHADPTLIPIHWTTNDAGPVAADEGSHQCAAWDRIESWMSDHSFDPFEPGLLMHPTFGNPYTANDTHPDLGVSELGNGSLLNKDGKNDRQESSYT